MILRNEPIEAYHAHPAVSKSGLVTFKESPRLFHHQWVKGERPPPTEAQRLGIATDLWVTEGEAAFRKVVAVEPDESPNRRAKAYQEWKAEQDAAGLIVVSQEYVATIRDQVEAIRENPDAEALIGMSEAQVTLRTTEPETGEEIQSRPDFLAMEGPARFDFAPISSDLKTTSDMARFARFEIMDRGYALQQAFVRLAAGDLEQLEASQMRHAIIAVTKDRPCRAEVFWLSPDLVACAVVEARHWLKKLRDCRESGEWPRTHTPKREYACPTYYAERWSAEMTNDDALAASGWRE